MFVSRHPEAAALERPSRVAGEAEMATSITLEALGLNQDEIADRVIDSAVRQLLARTVADEDGDEIEIASSFRKTITGMVTARVDEKVREIGNAHVVPNVAAMIENLVLTKTNNWGEKAAEGSVTFIEYITAQAGAYMGEMVDHNGKTKAQDAYNWRANTTRIAYLIDQHLQYSIKTAMENALKEANTAMAKGLHEACRVAINNVAANFAVVAKTGR